MASNSANPIHQGGRTLSRMTRKGKDGGGKKKGRKRVWFTIGDGKKSQAPESNKARYGESREQ